QQANPVVRSLLWIFPLTFLLFGYSSASAWAGLECTDLYGDPEMCKTWQEQGECDVTDWMLENCQRACGLCDLDESEDERFLRIMQDIYKYRYREFPEHGSFVGFHDYDDKLESFTMA
ncbi:hypothetical protein EGW08_012649, partial [Elysia chlorotica]